MAASRNGAHVTPSSSRPRQGRNEPPFTVELVTLADLKPHPRNYVKHPEDELRHLAASLKAFGFYKNIVIAKDSTILAGHGVVQAAIIAGFKKGPVRRMPFGPKDPRALKILAGDNMMPLLSERDDRMLTELLRDIKLSSADLLGTGFDEMMLANLVFVSRTSDEILDKNAAAQWVGLPEYQDSYDRLHVTVYFATDKDQAAFAKLLGIEGMMGKTIDYPAPAGKARRDRDDLRSVAFTTNGRKAK